MKAHNKGSGSLFITNLRTFACKEYSKITLLPAGNKLYRLQIFHLMSMPTVGCKL